MADHNAPRGAETPKMRGYVDKGGVTRGDIDALLVRFYDNIRRDPALGPIFEAKIGVTEDVWGTHIAKIGDFWANVMLHERKYQGNPMQAHMALPDIQPDHFDAWLNLFEETAREVLPDGKANAFNSMARRIGSSLKMGIVQMRGDGPPDLS